MRLKAKGICSIISAVVLIAVTMVAFVACSASTEREDSSSAIESDTSVKTDIISNINSSSAAESKTSGKAVIIYAPSENYDATDTELGAVEAIMKKRLDTYGISDYDISINYDTDKVEVSLSLPTDERGYDTEIIADKLKKPAQLTFREGMDGVWEEGGSYEDLPVIVSGDDVESAYAQYALKDGNAQEYDYMVAIKFKDSGKQKFAEVTERLAESRGYISAYIDGEIISVAGVSEKIDNGQAVISGGFTLDEVMELANMINSGALPFKLEMISYDETLTKAD